ncbi:MAG TPA: hypothetical protein VMV59_05340 [Candidatus Dormibacteraeota bacterium]|nr:hypothetical protein [Candidatus Dormibacteraeota bacterium]
MPTANGTSKTPRANASEKQLSAEVRLDNRTPEVIADAKSRAAGRAREESEAGDNGH